LVRSSGFTLARFQSGNADLQLVKGKRERCRAYGFQMHAKDRQEIQGQLLLQAILLLPIGLKNVTTGDTLCDENTTHSHIYREE